MQRIALLVFFLLASSCSHVAGPRDVLPDETFASLHASLFETAAMQRQAGSDADRCRRAVDSVLRNAHVTRDQFAATLASVNVEVERWKSVSETAVRILEQRSGAQPDRR